jgi:hypothetical protein
VTFSNVPGAPQPQPVRRTNSLLWVAIGVAALALTCCGAGAIGKMLTDRPEGAAVDRPQAVAADDTTPAAPPAASSTPTSTPTASTPAPTATTAPATAPTSVYYANCDAARAAGAAPLRRGEPGYRPPLDGDNDGVACETGGGNPGGNPGGGDQGGQDDPGNPPGTDPQFGTCKEAKANGYGPYRRGQDPEYAWYRDADNDGVVCE